MIPKFTTHTYGEGVINTTRNLAYFHIPKNASMWARQYIANLGVGYNEDTWVAAYSPDLDRASYTNLVILRDPVERWLSYCPWVTSIPTVTKKKLISVLLESADALFRDEHLAPQTWFHEQGSHNQSSIFFKVDKDLYTNLQQYFNEQGFLQWDHTPAIFNQRPISDSRLLAEELWSNWFEDTEVFEHWQNLYKKDYELIEAVTYYTTPES